MGIAAWGACLLFLAATAAGSSFPPLVAGGERLGDVETLLEEIDRRSSTNAVAFSPDGKTLAAASDDDVVRLWDADTGETTRRLEGHASGVLSVAFSPDGKKLASASADHTVRLWDLASGEETLRPLVGHDSAVRSVVFSPDGKTLASASADRSVRLWDLASGKTSRLLEGHESGVLSVAFSPDGKTLASASSDRSVRLWHTASGEEIRRLVGHESGVLSVAFSSDGKTLASASSDGTLRLWNLTPGETTHRVLTGHESGVLSVAFSPDDKTLASASSDHTVRLWDLASGVAIEVLEGHDSGVVSVVFSPDGKLLASASHDRTVRLLSFVSGETTKRLEGHDSEVLSLAFSPDARNLASAFSDRTVRLWDIASGGTTKLLEGHDDEVVSVAFSPDGEVLASASYDRTARLWDTASGEMTKNLVGHDSWVLSVAFSPDSRTLASASDDRTVRLWDVTSGETTKILKGHDDRIFSVAFSPDGKTLASASSDSTVRIWDIASGQPTQRLEGHDSGVLFVALSPDGKTLASASYDHTVRLWDIASGETIRRLEGHGDWVLAVAFSPDGKTLASASEDGTVGLWDIPSGETPSFLNGPDTGVFSLAFSPDGKTLASGSTEIRLGSSRNGFETSRIFFGGRQGAWLSCDLAGTCLRHDTGDLVVRRRSNGRLERVPPQVAAVPPQLELLEAPPVSIETLDGESSEIVLKVRNNGRHRAFGLRVRRLDESPNDPLVVVLPATRALLEPGEIAELPCRIATHSTHDNPDEQTSTLSLEITSLHSEPLSVPVIKVQAKVPSLALDSARWAEAPDGPTVVAALVNKGRQALPSARIDAAVNVLAQKLPSVHHDRPVEPGETFLIAFEAPRFQPDDLTRVTITVTKPEHPVHVWRFADLPFATAGLNGTLVAGLAMLLLASLVAVVLFGHPLVRQLSETPSDLHTRLPSELSRARRFLLLTGRLSSVLDSAGIERVWLDDAIAFFADPGPGSRLRRLAQRLGLKANIAEEGTDHDDELRALPLGPAFRLNVGRLLVHQPPPGRPAADVLNRLRQRLETRDQITLILAADLAAQEELHRLVATDRSHLLVAPSGAELTELLLASDPLGQLALTIASQVRLVRVSPYQTGGGVQKESGFFGRDELITHILSRESANYLVVGGRQVGKSSLLKAIERRALDEPRLDALSVVLSGGDLTRSLARVLGLPRDARLEHVLAKLRKKDGRTLLLIDEADLFVRSPGSEEVLAQMRSLSEEGRCHFLLAGYWHLYDDAVLDYHSPLRNFGETLRIGALEKEACRQLATQPMASMDSPTKPKRASSG